MRKPAHLSQARSRRSIGLPAFRTFYRYLQDPQQECEKRLERNDDQAEAEHDDTRDFGIIQRAETEMRPARHGIEEEQRATDETDAGIGGQAIGADGSGQPIGPSA